MVRPLLPGVAIPSAAKLLPGGVRPDLCTPTLVSWSFRIEQTLSANTALIVGYIGSHRD